jgi:hypothetical protein
MSYRQPDRMSPTTGSMHGVAGVRRWLDKGADGFM